MNYNFISIGFVLKIFILNYYFVFCEISQQKKLIEANDLNNELNDRLLAHIRDKRENTNEVHVHVHIHNGNDDKDMNRDSNEENVDQNIDDKDKHKKKNKKKRKNKKNRKCTENDNRKRCKNRATTTPFTTLSDLTPLTTTTIIATPPYPSNPSTYYSDSTNDYQMISSQSSFPTEVFTEESTYMSVSTMDMMSSTQSPEVVKDTDESVVANKDINYRKPKKSENDDKHVVKDV